VFGHEHAVAAREAEVGGQRRALVAALLLHDLHEQDLADLDDLLDLVLAQLGLPRAADLFRDVLLGDRLDLLVAVGRVVHRAVGTLASRRAPLPSSSSRAGRLDRRLVDALHRGGALLVAHVDVALGLDDLHPVDVVADLARLDRIARRGGFGARLAARPRPALPAGLLLLLVLLRGHGGFLGEQRLPVRDGDLVVVGVDLREGEEAVPVPAVVHEGRLERRLYPRDLREVDVAG
jgi:hypothetical protein